ncbi:MAG: hypothetical protein PHH70_04250 [Candidatus Gracilibacteria bacterium]|nr:hypothetical protein [Candidatus Gracilibacteria bacterium]
MKNISAVLGILVMSSSVLASCSGPTNSDASAVDGTSQSGNMTSQTQNDPLSQKRNHSSRKVNSNSRNSIHSDTNSRAS